MKRHTSPYHPSAKKRVLIQCEGSGTELTYFLGVRGQCGRSTDLYLTVNRGYGGDAEVVMRRAVDEVKAAAERLEPYDFQYCVLDVETANSADKLTAARVLAAKHNITLYLSNPCFEVWLLCHFTRTLPHLRDGKAAKQHWEREYWRHMTGRDYKESDPQLYDLLKDSVPAAISNARHILEEHDGIRSCLAVNPSTEVYQLVERLLTSQTDPAP